MKKPLPYFLALACVYLLAACHHHPSVEETPFAHFQDPGTIHLVIETDFDSLFADAADPAYQSVKLTLKKGGCQDEHFHLQAKPRGVHRREMCEFPPLKLHFPEKALETASLNDYPTLKLVTHCKPDPVFEQLVLKEHLAFKFYNVLTDSSFRTQLARVRYVDSNGGHPDIERFGFLIESPDELAARMGGRILDEEHGMPKALHRPQFKLFTMFQFMIGNTDWALKNRHNVKLVEPAEGDPRLPMPVPYDFDFCGLVDAPYALPQTGLPVSDVKERFFQWKGSQQEDFTETVAVFKRKKAALFAVLDDCELLDENNRAEARGYLESFFEMLESEGAWAKR